MATHMVHTRLHRLDYLSLKGLRALDRARTVVLWPLGMLEEHGDHLPLGTDTFGVDAITLATAAWLLEHDKQLHILQLPTIPFGIDPVDLRRPELFSQAGSIWLNPETLKGLIVDVVGHVARYGFHYVFLLGFHGGKDQSILLDEVCREMRARHDGLMMYEPMGYVRAGAEEDMIPGMATLLGRPLTPQEEVALKGSIHASMLETSMMLHLRPELVDPVYKTLRSIEWSQLYRMEDWPGYVGAGPVHAKSEIGAAVLRWWGVRIGQLIRRAMEGEDISKLARHPKWYYEDEPEVAVQSDAARPSRVEPEVDSKPAMYISAKELAEKMPPEARPGARPAPDETPSSESMKTKPSVKTPPPTVTSNQEDEER